ncbi:MAG: Tat pathway signal protein [Acidobacteria bacterium]|nr:MAG: Tat pathway signal protein [Acidobacteriota bacterium]
MRRRRFLQNLAAGTAGISYLPSGWRDDAAPLEESSKIAPLIEDSGSLADVDGHTLLCEVQYSGKNWKVYEDLRTRDGAIVFLSNQGTKRVLPKSAEAVFAEGEPPYLGLNLDEIGLAGADLLADRLLQGGDDPDPAAVKSAAPPQASNTKERGGGFRLPWNTLVGTRECFDTMPVFATGRTRTYHPEQYFSEITQELAAKRFEGLVGGWMPAVRKVLPLSDSSYLEIVVFGDVEAKDKFIVQTWHRTARVENGKMTKVVYGYSYPAFPPRRKDPAPEAFYRALLVFAEYWDRQLHDASPVSLPDETYVNMSRHAIARELMVRPGGVYPKYGAVDRDYYGSEYDGFQDIFTSAVYTNLEWGRFTAAKQIIDNYFGDFVDEKGMINMRGPETAQFGMTLSLLARYYNYTRDAALLQKHRPKIEATAALLEELHEESLRLPSDDPGYALIHGWSESDSCLSSKPMTWWLPYFANSAFASRGLKDLARVWPEVHGAKAAASESLAKEWLKRSKALEDAMVAAVRKDIRHDMTPPYIGPFPGTSLTFRDSLAKERPSPQQWPHRPYAELLQADILPADLANLVIDCMRAYGATTLGVVANVSRARPGSREILGFISYGYAQMLLRLDRVEEFLLFLYSHHYHDHTRGSWTAGEVSDINGGTALFCIPAQQTIPLLVRWMLVLEDSDEEVLYLGKGVPRAWLVSGSPIRIENAPTRWGRVTLELRADPSTRHIAGKILLAAAGKPAQVQVKLRLPLQSAFSRVTVNGHDAKLAGKRNDTVLISTRQQKQFDISAQYDAS